MHLKASMHTTETCIKIIADVAEDFTNTQVTQDKILHAWFLLNTQDSKKQ